MIKCVLTILLIATTNLLSAQYLHYYDNSKRKFVASEKPVENKPAPSPPVKDSPAQKAVVYHQWPDRCPGLTGSIPILSSYVPKELVLKMTEYYKGHLYSISPVRIDRNTMHYKLKVCEKGEIKYKLADENGDIIEEP